MSARETQLPRKTSLRIRSGSAAATRQAATTAHEHAKRSTGSPPSASSTVASVRASLAAVGSASRSDTPQPSRS
jgi:hypothetical protein